MCVCVCSVYLLWEEGYECGLGGSLSVHDKSLRIIITKKYMCL